MRLVYICDWLPPDFGAVGQYSLLFAREAASEGCAVTLIGLTTGNEGRQAAYTVGQGTLEIIRVHRPAYDKEKFATRLAWTIVSNFLLLRAAYPAMRRADAISFTGSPPLLLHFIAPLNMLLRKQLIYRITDFYPECLIAQKGRSGLLLGLLLRLTRFWRRRVGNFEVLGVDQAKRLAESRIPAGRIRLKRNPSPVKFPHHVRPLPAPPELQRGAGVILYSGNWGAAHDEMTFLDAYTEYRKQSPDGLLFWLNAIGRGADRIERELRTRGAPFYRSRLVALEEVPRLLVAADVHLITLRDSFVGYVLPSKIHACIESGKPILFVGSAESDVHLLASSAPSAGHYRRVNNGDVAALVNALHVAERSVLISKQLAAG